MTFPRLLTTFLIGSAGVAAAACGAPVEPEAQFVATTEIRGFDPCFSGDGTSIFVQGQVFEKLVEVHPFKVPLQLQPLLAESPPEVSADGRVYTFRLREARYQDDPCFPDGRGRRVTAQDFVWCFKRLAAVPTSIGSWIIAGRLKGLDEWTLRIRERLRPMLDRVNTWYPFEDPSLQGLVDEEVPGLRALDDRTLRFELDAPCPYFQWLLAMNYAAVYPPEALRRYGMNFDNRPVGCGPYRVEDYFVYDKKAVFVRNPNWHGQRFPEEGAPGDREAGLLDDAGKEMPFIDRAELVVVTKSQPMWLKFVEGGLERILMDKDIWERAMTPEGTLRSDLAAKGINVQHQAMLNINYIAFGMEDPVVGLPAGEQGRKLRQAMSLAFDRDLWLKVMRNGVWGAPADGPVPPAIPGYVAGTGSPFAHRDVERAKALLAEAGWPGGRGLPVLHYEMRNMEAETRNGAELFKHCMAEIGIEVDLNGSTFPQFLAKLKNKQAQVFGLSWTADYPDVENFLLLFYGANEPPGANGASYKNPRFDELYRRMSVMSPCQEREALVREMLAIVNEDCPWIYTDCRIAYTCAQSWLRNAKYSDFSPADIKYLRIDRRDKARRLAGAEPSR